VKWTKEHLQSLKRTGKIRDFTCAEPEKKSGRAKYGNNKVEWQGLKFDSTKEYLRYRELLLLLKHGVIGQLRRQVPYELNEGGTHSYKYVADHVYMMADTGETIVEDVKGHLTVVYKKKRKLMKKLFNITILEV